MKKLSEIKKYIGYIVAFMVIYVLIVTGCGGTASDLIITPTPEYISENTIPINPDGSINAYTRSGIALKAESNTFDPDVKLKITENKAFEGVDGEFSSISSLFTISAEKLQNSSWGESKKKVTDVARPVIITIPNDIGKAGTYYVGVRANSSSSWKYILVNDKNSATNPLPVYSRYAVDNNAPEYYVSTYNVDFQFSLFVESPEKKDDDKDKTVITDFKAEAEPSEYELVNSCYSKDITVKATVYGDNINKLTASDYVVEIGFLSEEKRTHSQYTFPISGAIATYDISEPDAGAGNKYKHTVTLKSISDYNNNTLSFGIGASKLTQEIFPDNFTVTLKVDGTSKILAYQNTKGITLTTQKQDDPLTIATATMTIPAALDAPIATNVVISFSDSIKWEQDSKNLVTLYNGQNFVECEYSYNSSDNTLTLTPAAELLFNTRYTVNVSKFLTNTSADQQFEFTTVESAGTPSISADTSKSSDGRFYLVAGQIFHIDFNKVILNSDTAKYQIYMQKNGVDFRYFNVDFDTEKRIATINVETPFEADQTYTVGIKEFTDSDGTVIKSASIQVEALPSITLESIEIDYGTGWQIASGCVEALNTGKIRVTLTQPIDPSAVKLLDKNGSEMAEPFIAGKTTEKSSSIEFKYVKLDYMATYGVVVSYADAVSGQSLESDVHTFTIKTPDYPVLANESAANSESNPYLIYSAVAFDHIRDDEFLAENYYFKQMVDIDLSPSAYSSPNNTTENGWKPFGRYDSITYTDIGFIGHYDGNNKTINNMFCKNDEPKGYLSLFGAIIEGSVSNLGVENVKIEGHSYIGALAGYVNDAKITNCHSSGEILYEDNAGGLIGCCDIINISNSYSTAKVIANGGTFDNFVGGLIGTANSNIKVIDCYATGEVTGLNYLGGLIGLIGDTSYISDTQAVIDTCYATNTVKGQDNVGGLIGYVNIENCIINSCYVTDGTISGRNNVGGFAGIIQSNAEVSNSYTKNITVEADGNNVGGIVGLNHGYMENCQSSGTVKGTDNVGGVVGFNECIEYKYWPSVSRTESECNVEGQNNIGGIIGHNTSSMESCKASGTIKGVDKVGGIIGFHDNSANSWISAYSLESKCTVKGNDYVGGVIGHNLEGYYSELTFDNVTVTGNVPEHTHDDIGYDELLEG